MSFLNLRISGRLYAGFSVLVVFVLALAGFAVWKMSAIQGQVGKMTAISQNAVRVLDISVHLQAIRRAVLRYNFDGDEPSFKESADRETKAVAKHRLSTSQIAMVLAAAARALPPME